MRRYRTLAGIAAALIVAGGVLAVSSGQTPALPPPVTLRGDAPSTSGTVSDTGLEFVPPTVADMRPSTTSTSLDTAGSPDRAETAASPDVITPEDDRDDPDTPASPDATDTPDTTDSPDLPDTPDSVDSPDDGA